MSYSSILILTFYLLILICYIIKKIYCFFTKTRTVIECDLDQDTYKTYRCWDNKLVKKIKVTNYSYILDPFYENTIHKS